MLPLYHRIYRNWFNDFEVFLGGKHFYYYKLCIPTAETCVRILLGLNGVTHSPQGVTHSPQIYLPSPSLHITSHLFYIYRAWDWFFKLIAFIPAYCFSCGILLRNAITHCAKVLYILVLILLFRHYAKSLLEGSTFGTLRVPVGAFHRDWILHLPGTTQLRVPPGIGPGQNNDHFCSRWCSVLVIP